MNEQLERENNFLLNGWYFHILHVSVKSTCAYLRQFYNVSVKKRDKNGKKSKRFKSFHSNCFFPWDYSGVHLFTVNPNLFNNRRFPTDV